MIFVERENIMELIFLFIDKFILKRKYRLNGLYINNSKNSLK